MIHSTLTNLRDILNEKFKNEFSVRDNKVALTNLINQDGTFPNDIDNKIVFFLVSLDEETTLKNYINRKTPPSDDFHSFSSPSLNINLRLLFCSNFTDKNYTEGLRYLSSLILFFKRNNRITTSSDSSPGNTMSFELCKMDFNEMSHLWSAVGSKLMPSVLYKVKLIAFEPGPVKKKVPSIKETEG